MKYTIHGLQQQKLLELALTNDDALILSVLKDRYSSMKMDYTIIDNQRYIWVDYSNVIENDIPILYKKRKNNNSDKASKSNLMSKIKNYAELGLIKRKTLYEKNGVRGTYAYICLTSKFDYLTEYEKSSISNEKTEGIQKKDRGYPKKEQGVSKKRIGGIQKKDNKDSPTRDSLINDSPTTEKKKNIVVDEIFLKNYIAEFKKLYKGDFDKKILKNLYISKGEDILNKYLNDYQLFLDASTKEVRDICKLFNYIVTNERGIPVSYKPNIKQNKPIQETNYEQREYDDDFFNSLYDNVKFIK